jgi:hypothetical protein
MLVHFTNTLFLHLHYTCLLNLVAGQGRQRLHSIAEQSLFRWLHMLDLESFYNLIVFF